MKTLASKFNELKQESLTSLASESMTSMTSTDTEKGSHSTVGTATQRRPILVRKNSGNCVGEQNFYGAFLDLDPQLTSRLSTNHTNSIKVKFGVPLDLIKK